MNLEQTNQKKLKVAIVGTNGLPGRYGGWDQLMNHLTINLEEEFDFTVYTSSFDREKGVKFVNGAKIEIVYLKANGYQSVIYDGWSMLHAIFRNDVILVLGTSGCIFLPFINLFKTPIVLNPDGAEWKRKKWSKPVQKFLKFSEKIGVQKSSMVISDNKVIQNDLLTDYSVKSELIEYGGDHVKPSRLEKLTERKYGIESNQYAFKVCRIEPENNIDMILESFESTKYPLVMIGNWNFSQYGRDLKDRYSSTKNLNLLDPIYEQSTLDELRSNCHYYIHGHSVGGTNPSLVEAMSLGLNCVIFDVSYNRETTENKAHYFKSSSELSEIISTVASNKIQISNGDTLKSIANRRYTWDKIVDRYKQTILEAYRREKTS